MLKTNTLGLPVLLEADNQINSMKDIMKYFSALDNKHSSLVVRNYKEEDLKHCTYSYVENRSKNLLFITKSKRYYQHWFTDHHAKRYLRLEKKLFEIDNLLFIESLSPFTGYRKGISEKQFKEEIFKKDYETVVISTSRRTSEDLVVPHLLDRGFKRMISVLYKHYNQPNYSRTDFLNIFMKD